MADNVLRARVGDGWACDLTKGSSSEKREVTGTRELAVAFRMWFHLSSDRRCLQSETTGNLTASSTREALRNVLYWGNDCCYLERGY